MYYIYILKCSDNSYYTGITNNISSRLLKHQAGKGSKYVRSRLPFNLVYKEEVDSKSLALKREIIIKKLSKNKKLELISNILV